MARPQPGPRGWTEGAIQVKLRSACTEGRASTPTCQCQLYPWVFLHTQSTLLSSAREAEDGIL